MRIYTRSGDLAFKSFTFPDGQPHFKLETYGAEFAEVTIETALKSASDLLLVLLVVDVLRANGYSSINLDVRYLVGARMDRAISVSEPFTLRTVAALINSAGFTRVRILDAHSEVATRLIRNSVNVLPSTIVGTVINTLAGCDVVIPDKGAGPRVHAMLNSVQIGYFGWTHQCYKERDVATGELKGFKIPSEGLKGRNLLIIDDICDGGGTFTGLAAKLLEAGAAKVDLFVTHGIFSKGLPLKGIDTVYTTDSFQPDTYGFNKVVCIPISMKEL